jgi:hypothetical protein
MLLGGTNYQNEATTSADLLAIRRHFNSWDQQNQQILTYNQVLSSRLLEMITALKCLSNHASLGADQLWLSE